MSSSGLPKVSELTSISCCYCCLLGPMHDLFSGLVSSVILHGLPLILLTQTPIDVMYKITNTVITEKKIIFTSEVSIPKHTNNEYMFEADSPDVCYYKRCKHIIPNKHRLPPMTYSTWFILQKHNVYVNPINAVTCTIHTVEVPTKLITSLTYVIKDSTPTILWYSIGSGLDFIIKSKDNKEQQRISFQQKATCTLLTPSSGVITTLFKNTTLPNMHLSIQLSQSSEHIYKIYLTQKVPLYICVPSWSRQSVQQITFKGNRYEGMSTIITNTPRVDDRYLPVSTILYQRSQLISICEQYVSTPSTMFQLSYIYILRNGCEEQLTLELQDGSTYYLAQTTDNLCLIQTNDSDMIPNACITGIYSKYHPIIGPVMILLTKLEHISLSITSTKQWKAGLCDCYNAVYLAKYTNNIAVATYLFLTMQQSKMFLQDGNFAYKLLSINLHDSQIGELSDLFNTVIKTQHGNMFLSNTLLPIYPYPLDLPRICCSNQSILYECKLSENILGTPKMYSTVASLDIIIPLLHPNNNDCKSLIVDGFKSLITTHPIKDLLISKLVSAAPALIIYPLMNNSTIPVDDAIKIKIIGVLLQDVIYPAYKRLCTTYPLMSIPTSYYLDNKNNSSNLSMLCIHRSYKLGWITVTSKGLSRAEYSIFGAREIPVFVEINPHNNELALLYWEGDDIKAILDEHLETIDHINITQISYMKSDMSTPKSDIINHDNSFPRTQPNVASTSFLCPKTCHYTVITCTPILHHNSNNLLKPVQIVENINIYTEPELEILALLLHKCQKHLLTHNTLETSSICIDIVSEKLYLNILSDHTISVPTYM